MLVKGLLAIAAVLLITKFVAGFFKKDWPVLTWATSALWVSFIVFELFQLGKALWFKFGAA